ncbi:hypothetical protein J7E93_30285 [Streptomyces sp. ISL-36]|uniref:hypothetical protein n=1 Tax=Streptomyces sp. ISL-36 TaxID=2819182 RepID=UPI001BEB371F|nr:hypothetical protein [Streptomyces sp. ISL-36]MBT2444307.1 hypothetical protein [Streptomyces sp. ISL-36]
MATSGRARAWRLPASVPGVVAGAAGTLLLGLAIGLVADPNALVGTGGYLFGAGLLLAVGLYGSTYSMDLTALRADLSGVVAAVTLGVVLKASLIAGVMVLSFGRPEYVVLGIAVAQIDPLSVAALGRSGRMSPRARSLLTAWASFDDPMTVLLTLYVAAYAHTAAGHAGAPAVTGDGARGYATGLALNAALLAGVVLLWWAGRKAAPAVAARLPKARHAGTVLTGAMVVAMLVLAAADMLMLAVAVAGLVVRTAVLDKAVDRAVTAAYLAAFLALGLFLAQGVALLPGVVLGLAAFGAQAVVALGVMPLFVRGLERRDRIALGLGQQNGITAVLIALALERDFPGTVATVGPAVITVNLLHATSQALLARPPRRWRRRDRGEELDAGEERPAGYDQPAARETSPRGPLANGRSPA